MTFIDAVKCDECGREETIRWTSIYYYLLPDMHRIPSCAIPTWCFDCDGIRDSEELFPVEALADKLAHLEANGLNETEFKEKAAFLRVKLDPRVEYENELAGVRAELAWRTARQSPPRCLACGSINHMPIEWIDEAVIHPGCPGRFRRVKWWHALERVHLEVDGEGRDIDRER